MHTLTDTSDFATGHSPAVLDALYDNRAHVPEHPKHLKAWAEDSATAREALDGHLDVAYGPGASDTLDVFLPDASIPRQGAFPVVVFLHGGYWRSLDKSDHSFVAPALCARGVGVVVVNYALCPGTSEYPVRIPDIGAQVAKGVKWLVDNIAAFGCDPRRLVAVGHSAGGQLAAMMLLGTQSAPWPALRQAVSISGVFDLEPLMQAPSFQASLQLDPQQVAQASPARLPPPVAGRLRALVGGDETAEFLRQNDLIQKRWGPTTVPVAQALPGLNHFSILQTLANPDSALFAQVWAAVQETEQAAL